MEARRVVVEPILALPSQISLTQSKENADSRAAGFMLRATSHRQLNSSLFRRVIRNLFQT